MSGAPVCLQCLLDDLMAHESYVEPAFGLKQILGHFKVFVGYVNPVSGFVCCHFRCHFVVYGGKFTKSFRYYNAFRWKNTKNVPIILRTGEDFLRIGARCFAYRRKVFCVYAYGCECRPLPLPATGNNHVCYGLQPCLLRATTMSATGFNTVRKQEKPEYPRIEEKQTK